MSIIDGSWVKYLQAVEEGKRLKASLWASFISILVTYNVTEYVRDKRLIGATVLGAFIGTYFTVKEKV